MLGEERPISWLERLKIACCEPSEGGYVTDDSNDIIFKNQPERPPLTRGAARGARGGGPLCPPEKEEEQEEQQQQKRGTFPATLALPKKPPPVLMSTVTMEHDYAEGVDLNNLRSARTEVTVASPYPDVAPTAAWDPIATAEEKVGRTYRYTTVLQQYCTRR